MESLEDKVRRVNAETIEIVAYDAGWPAQYESEKRRLFARFPEGWILRIEHVGSTAVAGTGGEAHRRHAGRGHRRAGSA